MTRLGVVTSRPTKATGQTRARRGSAFAKCIVAAAAVGVLTSGCGSGGFQGLYGTPLPGGADVGSHPYRVKVAFRDVLDLVPQAGVRVNDVPVGRVERVDLAKDGWTAEVTVLVNGDVALPANALAQLRQSSLLGEKFVELLPPAAGAQGKLTNGMTIGIDRTNRNPEVEEVLGALSLLLNGGGVEQLQTIAKELNNATQGNESQLRSMLTNVNTLVADLDAHKSNITAALDGLNRLSATLAGQRSQIGGVLDNLGPGLKVLADQRQQLVTMLQSLDRLSGVSVNVVNSTRDQLVADLKALSPTLNQLAQAGVNLPKALQLLFTYPFPDSALSGIKGDYTNTFINLDLNLKDVASTLGGQSLQGSPTQPGAAVNPPAITVPPLLGSSPGTPKPGNGNSGLGGLLGGLLGGK
jgi:phospholipid/cholesterol/gamma-HCH transport system substrate-binding protein